MSFTVQMISETNQRSKLISTAHIPTLYKLLFSAAMLFILGLQHGGIELT